MNKLNSEQQKLVVENLNFVHYIIKTKFRMNPGNQDYNDYFQEGALALCEAVMKYDPDLGYKLSTYAATFIWGKLMTYKRDCMSLIKYSRAIKDIKCKIAMYINENPDSDIYTMMEDLNITSKQFIAANTFVVGFDDIKRLDKEGDELETEPLEIIYNPNEKSIEVQHELFQIYDDIENFLNEIHFSNDVHKQVFTEYIYDIIYLDKSSNRISQKEYSSKYNISQAQVSRIIKTYMSKLREFIKDYKSLL